MIDKKKFPFVRDFVINPTTKGVLHLSSEIRGEESVKLEIQVDVNAEFCKLIIELLDITKKEKEIPPQFIKYLNKAGLLIEVPEIPNDITFKCLLDLPDEEIIFPFEKSEYKINPKIFFQKSHAIPEIIKKNLTNVACLSKDYPVLWVEEPITKVIYPYWLSEISYKILAKILKSKNLNKIPDNVFNLLIQTKIIIPNNPDDNLYFEKAKAEISEKGFTVLRNVFNPIQIQSLKNYYKRLQENNCFIRSDAHVSQRDSIPNESIARFFHYQLGKIVNIILPQQVEPSYCYISIYNEGSVLSRHKDREECEWNVSLLLDMIPECEVENAWPFFIQSNNMKNEIRLGAGDAVIYRGSKVYHWREKLPEKSRYTIFFFHFVNCPKD